MLNGQLGVGENVILIFQDVRDGITNTLWKEKAMTKNQANILLSILFIALASWLVHDYLHDHCCKTPPKPVKRIVVDRYTKLPKHLPVNTVAAPSTLLLMGFGLGLIKWRRK